MMPEILSHLGQDSLASLKKLAEMYSAKAGAEPTADDDVPELVENFEAAAASTSA